MRPLPFVILALLVALPATATTFWRDWDHDGYGNAAGSTTATSMPPGFADNPNDCNDQDATVHPGAGEACNGRDDDCNGAIDDGVTPIPSYIDFDGDGYGQDATMVLRCPVPAGWVINGGDCNDADPKLHPSAIETCGNGIDDDCDGFVDEFCGAPFGIAEVIDRPGDEGHAVLVRFHAHPYDIPAGAPVRIVEYRVQRRPIGAEGVPYSWETVATVPATQFVDYEAVAPTWCSESASGPCNVTFVVRAIADVPGVAYDTAPDSGSSVDDTAPEAPASIVATYVPRSITLDWQPSPSPDVAFYRVYKENLTHLCPPCTGWIPVTTTTPEVRTFSGPYGSGPLYNNYAVAAVDTAGNESGVVIPSVVGVEPASAPGTFVLLAPSPNPSRAEVALAWTMPARGAVHLRVIDLAGRTVRTLVEGEREAGAQRSGWDGRDARGATVPAGAYFVRLDSAWGVQSRMLVRL